MSKGTVEEIAAFNQLKEDLNKAVDAAPEAAFGAPVLDKDGNVVDFKISGTVLKPSLPNFKIAAGASITSNISIGAIPMANFCSSVTDFPSLKFSNPALASP